MQEKLDQLYEEYFIDRLNTIFNDNSGVEIKNIFYSEPALTSDNSRVILSKYKYYELSEGVIICRSRNDKYNIMDREGNELSKVSFNKIESFHNGFAIVANSSDSNGNEFDFPNKEGNKYNFIDKRGKILSDEWFDSVRPFSEDYAVVVKNGEYGFVDKEGVFYPAFGSKSGYYEIIGDLHNGWALVRNRELGEVDRYNYINVHGNYIDNQWYREANDFSDGLARVSLYKQSNYDSFVFIKTDGSSPDRIKWYYDQYQIVDGKRCGVAPSFVGDFHDGWVLTKVYLDLNNFYYNYINNDGKLMFKTITRDEAFTSATDFKDGYAEVWYGNHTKAILMAGGNFLDCNPSLFYGGLGEGFFAYNKKNDNTYQIMNCKGELISNEFFDIHNTRFYKGEAQVKLNGLNYIINQRGELKPFPIEKYDKPYLINIGDLHHAHYVDENGIDISKHFYIYSETLPGIVRVLRQNGEYDVEQNNFFSVDEGKLLLNDWVPAFDLFAFKEGYACVRRKSDKYNNTPIEEYNFIDKRGNYLFKKWITNVDSKFIENGCISIKKGNQRTLMDLDGNLLMPYMDSNHTLKADYNFVYCDGKAQPKKIEMGDFTVKKGPLGHTVSNDKIKFKMKYQPVKIYGDRYVICLNNKKNTVLLYDRVSDKYQVIGSGELDCLKYDDDFIFTIDEHAKIVIYLMYGNEKIELPKEYVRDVLKNKEKLHITRGLSLLSKDDFSYHNEDEIRRIIEEEQDKIKKDEDERKRIANENKVKELKKQQEEEIDRKKQEANETVELIAQLLFKLSKIETETGIIKRIEFADIFINTGDHLEIVPFFRNDGHLKYIDLSNKSFKGVNLSGIDFRGCNVSFLTDDPQNVWKKDLSNCNFEGVCFLPGTIFTGVNVKGSIFTTDGNDKTMDITAESFADAIYDETTTLDGVPLTVLLKKEESRRI